MSLFSIIIPCFNEENTLQICVERVLEIKDQNIAIEIIIVNDASNDNSLAIANKLADKYIELRVVSHAFNQGKGAALRTGFKIATGDFIAVQDADLEYNPLDLKKLIKPLINNQADVTLGSRFLTGSITRFPYFCHFMANRLLTFFSNIFTKLDLTDIQTCYKVFKRETIQNIDIEENRFGFDPEIIAKTARLRLRVFECAISYHGRSYNEGKKISIKDGIRALYCIFKYRPVQQGMCFKIKSIISSPLSYFSSISREP